MFIIIHALHEWYYILYTYVCLPLNVYQIYANIFCIIQRYDYVIHIKNLLYMCANKNEIDGMG